MKFCLIAIKLLLIKLNANNVIYINKFCIFAKLNSTQLPKLN